MVPHKTHQSQQLECRPRCLVPKVMQDTWTHPGKTKSPTVGPRSLDSKRLLVTNILSCPFVWHLNMPNGRLSRGTLGDGSLRAVFPWRSGPLRLPRWGTPQGPPASGRLCPFAASSPWRSLCLPALQVLRFLQPQVPASLALVQPSAGPARRQLTGKQVKIRPFLREWFHQK